MVGAPPLSYTQAQAPRLSGNGVGSRGTDRPALICPVDINFKHFPYHELKKPWFREGLWVPQVNLSGLISGRLHQGYNDLPEATHQRWQSWDQDLKSLNESNTWLQPSDRQASPCTQASPLHVPKPRLSSFVRDLSVTKGSAH